MNRCYKFLKCNERVCLEGTYNVSETSKTENTSTVLMKIDKNPLGMNFRVDEFYVVVEPNELLLETFSIHSYDQNGKSMGEIQFTSFYKNDTGSSLSQAGLYYYNVNSSNGIYKCVKRVVIDTNETVRKVYFVCDKCYDKCSKKC